MQFSSSQVKNIKIDFNYLREIFGYILHLGSQTIVKVKRSNRNSLSPKYQFGLCNVEDVKETDEGTDYLAVDMFDSEQVKLLDMIHYIYLHHNF